MEPSRSGESHVGMMMRAVVQRCIQSNNDKWDVNETLFGVST